jgi:hypothetical protein
MNKRKLTSDFIENYNEQSALFFFMLLLCADFLFIAFHSLAVLTPSFNNPLMSLEQDHGYPEVYQYIKWLWIILLLIFASVKRRSMYFSAWVFVYIYLLLDDSLEIHERVGALFEGSLSLVPPLGLRLQDIGELAVTGTAGLILLFFISLAYWHGPQTFKKMSIDMLLMIFALAFFGVFVDMLHVITYMADQISWKVSAVLAVIEDGGEMIVASLILFYVFLISLRNEKPTFSFFDFTHAVLTKRST